MRRFFVFLTLWISAWTTFAQVDFKARVSRSEISTDDRLRVDFTLNHAPEKFSPPAFKDFYVMMGPMQSSGRSVSIVNGHVTSSEQYTYSYVLAPKRAGTLEIAPATAIVDGKTYKTQPVRIQVFNAATTNQSIQNTKPGNRTIKTTQGKDAFLRLEITNPNPYVGQAIGAIYKLYVRQGVQIADYGQPNISEPKGFWTESISDKTQDLGVETVNGQPYRVFALRRLMLIPQHPGKLEITPQRFDLVILKRVVREWGMMQFYDEEPATIHLSTGKVIVNAKALPEKDKPVDFSGAVGTFDFMVDLAPQSVRTGGDVMMTLKLMGKGNLNMFDLPKPVFPDDWETYDPEHKVKTTPTYSGYRGVVSDVYTIIPEKPGKYTIPPVSFVYFDPYEKKYKRITSPSLTVDVSGAPVNVSGTSSTPVATGSRLSDIARKAGWKKAGGKVFFKTPAYHFWLWTPFVLLILFWLAVYIKRNRRIDPVKARGIRENRYIRHLLADARKNTGDKARFYGLLERALITYFKNRLNLSANEVTRRNVLEKLRKRQVDNVLIKQLQEVWNNIDTARYTPGSDETRQTDLDKVKTILTRLDKILKK